MFPKILLVDDEPMVLEALKRALRKEGYELAGANSAEQGLDILAKEKIDVVVSDEMMPGMAGSDFLGIVYSEYPETIRILLTGHPNLDTAIRAINKSQVYRFLIKPCSAIELSITIRQALQQKELSRNSLNLLETAKRQRIVLSNLEQEFPGITKVDRDMEGIINISDEPDIDELIEQINKEVSWSESFFSSIRKSDEEPN